MEISQQRKFKYWDAWGAILRGWAKSQLDQPSEGIAELRAGIDGYLSTGSTQILLYAKTLLADAYLGAGECQSGLEVIHEIRREMETNAVRFQAGMTDEVERALNAAAVRRA